MSRCLSESNNDAEKSTSCKYIVHANRCNSIHVAQAERLNNIYIYKDRHIEQHWKYLYLNVSCLGIILPALRIYKFGLDGHRRIREEMYVLLRTGLSVCVL